MAEVADVKALKKDQIVALAGANGVEVDANNTKDVLAEQVAAAITPEALEAFKADPANGVEAPKPPTPSGDEPTDPALTPTAPEAGDLKVGQSVFYPHDESEGGYRRGRVLSVSENEVAVSWVDGSSRLWSADKLRTE